jgi:RNA polymerase sigma-70 factor (ECF subfamily)
MSEDSELISLLKEKPDLGIKKIFDTYYATLVGTSYNLVKKEDVAKDIAQEVLLKLWENRDQFDIQKSLKNYLKRAAINSSINHIKSKHGKKWEEPEYLEIQDDYTAQKIDADDLEHLITNYISALPEKCRMVFMLSRFENLSNKEIAEHLDISVKTVESQITKALKFLRKTVLPHIHRLILLFSFFQLPS